MAKRAKPIEDTAAWEILQELERFADTEQCIPNEHAFYFNVLKPAGYEMTLSEYRWNFNRLQIEGYIRVNRATRAVQVLRRRIVNPSEVKILPCSENP